MKSANRIFAIARLVLLWWLIYELVAFKLEALVTKQNLPGFIRRDVERAIEHALHPTGMSTHDGKARIGVDRLQYLIRMIDGLEPVNDVVLEFLRAFIAGGVNQDFKLWASELYQKLYRGTAEPSADAPCSGCGKVPPNGGLYPILLCWGCSEHGFVLSGHTPTIREPEGESDDEQPVYSFAFALNIAKLWRAGKMIGGDEDAVRDALLTEIERLHAENRTGDA